MANPPKIQALDHLVLTVRDLAASIRFYENVLGMELVSFTGADGHARMALRFGAQKINLHEAGSEIAPHASAAVPGSADLCFLSDRSPEDWLAHFSALGCAVELGPVPRSGATGPLRSIYLRDPDGNLIEVSSHA